MPLNLSPTQAAFNARGDGRFNQPFAEQLQFFRQKLNLPTERYDDVLQTAHDRAFVVAGATKADLISDLRQSVDRAMAEGKSLGWFRKNFDQVVKRHGWEGWTGSDTQEGRDWRTRIIYRTNLASSYAAGRWQQLNDPDLLQSRPYWKYIHNDTVTHPRPLHVSWSGLVLKHDDVFWQAHFPPNGWGCRCRITAVTAEQFKGDVTPDDGEYSKKDGLGVEHRIPKGIDFGWDYAPGQSYTELMRRIIAKQDKAGALLARAHVSELVESKTFERFFNGKMPGEFPIAVLSAADQRLLGSQSPVVLLSRASIDAHLIKHPEITLVDYRKAQHIIDQGALYQQGEQRLIYLQQDNVWYRLALKRTEDGQKNYFLTLFRNDKASPPKTALKLR